MAAIAIVTIPSALERLFNGISHRARQKTTEKLALVGGAVRVPVRTVSSLYGGGGGKATGNGDQNGESKKKSAHGEIPPMELGDRKDDTKLGVAQHHL
jgi:hypothetical protein